MSDEKQYMLLFSLGPVQSFIAQARKTRDLMLGSFLLSMMMEAAMKNMKGTLIYPTNPIIENDIPDLPNKFVALFSQEQGALDAATESEAAIVTLWNIIREEVWNTLIHGAQLPEDEKVTRAIWDQQSDPRNFFEIFWVVAEGSPRQYTRWLNDAQEALDARKRFRNFEQQDEKGEKSTISGEREALRGSGQTRDEVRKFWEMLAQRELLTGQSPSPKDISQDGSERLDAIDTIKRFALLSKTVEQKLKNAAFPSTSMVAAAPFIVSLLEQIDISVLQKWLHETGRLAMPRDTVKALPYLKKKAQATLDHTDQRLDLLRRDGDLYFLETFTPKRLVEDYNVVPGERDKNVALRRAEKVASQGQNALKDLLEATDKLDIPRPTPYYAFIQMDGDNMGTVLGSITGLDNITAEQEHHNISEALSKFSRETVPSIVEEQYPGRLVYAGGDDVVALAPLVRNQVQDTSGIKTVLGLVDQLQKQYCETIKDQVLDQKNKERVTVSAGIAIAHHLTSLSYVRAAAKQAENNAKRHYGRNALVVTVLRRSGEQTRVGCRWHYDGLSNEGQPIPLFTKFYELFQQDLLSPKCVYILLEEAPGLVELGAKAQASEIKRVLLRQRSDKEKLSDSEIDKLSPYLADLAEKMDQDEKPRPAEGQERSTELHAEGRRYGLVEVLGWLQVAVFMARKELE